VERGGVGERTTTFSILLGWRRGGGGGTTEAALGLGILRCRLSGDDPRGRGSLSRMAQIPPVFQIQKRTTMLGDLENPFCHVRVDAAAQNIYFKMFRCFESNIELYIQIFYVALESYF
jgi:hypothetical protein